MLMEKNAYERVVVSGHYYFNITSGVILTMNISTTSVGYILIVIVYDIYVRYISQAQQL